MKPTSKFLETFHHVKSIHPNLSICILSLDEKWLYMDSDFEPIKFNGMENVSLLEDSISSIKKLPFIYQEL